MFFDRIGDIVKTREQIYKEEWEDWTKEDWISNQTPDEQKRLRALTPTKSDEEFINWRLVQNVGLCKKLDELREQGILPPLKGLPNYGNRPINGVIIAGSPLGGPGGFGGRGPGGGFGPGHGEPGGPGGGPCGPGH